MGEVINFSQLWVELQKQITSISAHSVFYILWFNCGILIDPDSPEGRPTNLLSTSILPLPSEIEELTLFYSWQGSLYCRENLSWTYDAICNSCDKELQGIIDARMLKYPTHSRFGPLYYYEIVKQMTSVDLKAVRTITRKLTQLKVTNQEGQCIAKVVKLIRATIIWLDMVNMKPPDINYIVYDIMKTCTVPNFILFLKTLETTASLNKVRLNANDILNKWEEQYCILSIMKRWDAVNHCGSTFLSRIPAQTRQVRNRPRISPPTWTRTPPTQEEAHERTHEGKLYKWCSTCNRWFFGNRAHLTIKHTAGY
jgi:hypothetical protein